MPRQLRWIQLIPGIVALASIVAAVLAILTFARVGAARGEQMRIYTAVPAARGIMRGSEVWLHGKPIGMVSEIGFAAPSEPVERRLVISLEVGERYRSYLRRDTDARVRAGGSFIGAPVIYLTGGSPTARAVGPGDTLIGRSRQDLESMGEAFGAATREFPAIMQNVRMIGSQLRATTGTIGAFTSGEGGVELGSLQERSARLATRFRQRDGTLGLVLDERVGVPVRARRLLASVDSVRALLASSDGELGRFRRDSTLARKVGEIRDEISIVRALLDEPRGSAGRFVHDRTLQLELARADSSLHLLLDDIKRRPLRYLHLF